MRAGKKQAPNNPELIEALVELSVVHQRIIEAHCGSDAEMFRHVKVWSPAQAMCCRMLRVPPACLTGQF